MKVNRNAMEDVRSKRWICMEFFSAYQNKDIEHMLSLCNAAGEVYFEPLAEAGEGKISELGKNLWLSLMKAFPDLNNTVIKTDWDETANTITCTVSIFGRQQQEFAGIPSQGNRFESDHIFVFHFNESEKIDQINIRWDHPRFVQQLTQ